MNLNGIVNKTLGLGNPLGPNMLMWECEPDFIAGGRAIALNSGDEEVPVGPNLEIGYCVVYDKSSKVVTYYPKTATFTIDDSKMRGGEDVRFVIPDPNEISGVTISDDGKHATVEMTETYRNCRDGYYVLGVPLDFTINPQPQGCIARYVNGEKFNSSYLVNVNTPRTLRITYEHTKC